jgi:hypothetical protein
VSIAAHAAPHNGRDTSLRGEGPAFPFVSAPRPGSQSTARPKYDRIIDIYEPGRPA